MPNLPERKVGIVACSGEEIAEGTVTRLAALKVLHELRRGETVTICLPLFLAGGEGDRAFAKFHPTITVDGCDLKCAAHGTETYSGKPAASIVVSELAAEHGIAGIDGRRCLNEAGQRGRRAHRRAAGRAGRSGAGQGGAPDAGADAETPAALQATQAVVGCSCGSGIPVKVLTIAGQSVEVVALPLIFEQAARGATVRPSDAVAQDLLEMVKIYNYVAPEAEAVLARGPCSGSTRPTANARRRDEPHGDLPHHRQVDRRALGPPGHGQRPGDEVLGAAGRPGACRRAHARGRLRRRREHLRDADVHLGEPSASS